MADVAWRQIRLQTKRAATELLEAALWQAGALSITYQDAKDEPILEPDIGTTPLWEYVIILGLFDGKTDIRDFYQQLVKSAELFQITSLECDDLEDEAWERSWLAHFKPQLFGKPDTGKTLCIYPSESHEPLESDVQICLDPGLAFGTGNHETTALCLDYMAQNAHDITAKKLIDFGTGSGILAIAAIKLGAKTCLACDIDPQAIIATCDNAARNQLTAQTLQCIDDWPKKSGLTVVQTGHENLFSNSENTADMIVANILLSPLLSLGDTFKKLLKTNGKLIVSGILATQIESLTDHYQTIGFKQNARITKGDWALVVFESGQ